MAPSALNGDGMGSLEEIKAPQGVVLPPREIKGAFLDYRYEASANTSQPSSKRRQVT